LLFAAALVSGHEFPPGSPKWIEGCAFRLLTNIGQPRYEHRSDRDSPISNAAQAVFERRSDTTPNRARRLTEIQDSLSDKAAARRELHRARVLDAAEAIIAEKGLPGLKARELADKAGCALGAIYIAFEDLDELVLRVNARTLALLEASLAPPPEPLKKKKELRRLALGYLRFARANAPRWKALFDHRLPPEKPLPQRYFAERERLFQLLEAPLARLLPQEDPEQRRLKAGTLFSAVHGITSLGLEEKLAPTPEATLEAQLSDFIEILLRGLSDD
jgi:AcrR family transcriptional regulator